MQLYFFAYHQIDLFVFLLTAPHPLSPPIGLKYTLLVSATNVSVMVVWKPPNQNTDVLSYRLLWGLAVKQHGVPQPVMDRNTAVSIKLNHVSVSSFLILSITLLVFSL